MLLMQLTAPFFPAPMPVQESNRSRTLLYTGVEVAVLLAMAAAQVFMVVKMFSSGKVKISV